MFSDAQKGDRVVDDTGIEFVLGDMLGRPGAQGAVFRVDGQPNFAIKILKHKTDLERIERVRRLPLSGLQIASPISLIRKGGAGYLMPLASDMTPLAAPYLPRDFGPTVINKPDWYRNTGGLARRLAIGGSVAECIAGLHERGLAYVDLNPNNVMVSDDVSHSETWLIDTDNLTSRAYPEWAVIGYPGYAAPERLIRQAPPSTLADAYTLAVLVFRLLVLRHPLDGALAATMDGESAQEAIDSGRFPYVADPVLASNRIPSRTLEATLLDIALSSGLRSVLLETFTDGKLDPLKRPGAARYRDALWLAHDNVIECSVGCGWTFYRNHSECPACGEPAAPMTVATILPEWFDGFSSDLTRQVRRSVVISKVSSTVFQSRQLFGTYESHDPLVSFRPTSGGYEIVSGDAAGVTDSGGKAIEWIEMIKPGKKMTLRVEVAKRPPRLLHLSCRARA